MKFLQAAPAKEEFVQKMLYKQMSQLETGGVMEHWLNDVYNQVQMLVLLLRPPEHSPEMYKFKRDRHQRRSERRGVEKEL